MINIPSRTRIINGYKSERINTPIIDNRTFNSVYMPRVPKYLLTHRLAYNFSNQILNETLFGI